MSSSKSEFRDFNLLPSGWLKNCCKPSMDRLYHSKNQEEGARGSEDCSGNKWGQGVKKTRKMM